MELEARRQELQKSPKCPKTVTHTYDYISSIPEWQAPHGTAYKQQIDCQWLLQTNLSPNQHPDDFELPTKK